jgi:hypothetical protein
MRTMRWSDDSATYTRPAASATIPWGSARPAASVRTRPVAETSKTLPTQKPALT